jgi:DNA repair protein SbcC/Rad50
LKPLKIKLTDFLAYSGTHELDLSAIHAAVICGPNESGKSSLIDSILYALFGQARKRTEELINEVADKMLVELTFSHANSTYVVERSQKAAKQSLKIAQDGKDISERLLGATQKKLDGIVGISYELMLSTAIAQQEEINKLSTMGASDRERVLCEMLRIDQWEKKKEKVNNKLKDYKDLDNNISMYEKEILELNVKIGAIEDELKDKRKDLEISNSLKVDYHEKATALMGKFEAAKAFNELESAQYTLEGQITALEKALSNFNITKMNGEIEQELESTVNEIKENEELILGTTKCIEELEIEGNKIAKDKTESLSLRVSSSQTELLNKVPCAGMDINSQCELLASANSAKKKLDEYMKCHKGMSIQQINESLEKEYVDFSNKLTFYRDSKADLIQLNNKLTIKKGDILKEKDSNKRFNEVKLDIVNKKTKLAEVKTKLQKKPNFDNTEYDQINENLSKITKQYQELSVVVGKLETEVEYTQKAIDNGKERLNGLYNTRSSIASYRTLQQAYSDIPTLLFEQAIPTIEQYTNEILSKISPGKVIQLRSFKETKSNTLQKALDVVSNTGRDYANNCGSEKVRQSLALRVALSRYNSEQNSIEMPFFILDEGSLGALDDNNLMLTKSTLREIADQFELFLIVTHLTELKDIFDTQILINPAGKDNKIQVIQ